MGNTANVYHGPLASVYLGTTQLGYVGEGSNFEIVFEPAPQAFNDGQNYQLYGMGRFTLEIMETDAGMIASASAAVATETAVTASDINGNTYNIQPSLVSYTTTRGFGENAHMIILTGQKKALDEDDWVAIT